MKKIYYFAYGSNLHPFRLKERTPSCRALDTAELRGYELRFHKKGRDDSGKCDAYATGSIKDRIRGVVYEIRGREKARLDEAEGLGRGYNEGIVVVRQGRKRYSAFAYFADPAHILPFLKPFSWYKRLVLKGALHHRFSSTCLCRIRTVPAATEEDVLRKNYHFRLLSKKIKEK